MSIFATAFENKTWLCNNSLVNNITSSNKLLLKDCENGVIEAIAPEKGVFCTKNVPTENAKSNFLLVVFTKRLLKKCLNIGLLYDI